MEPRPDEPDDAPPPWLQPGCTRRDSEPHRGKLLGCLARLGMLSGFLSVGLGTACVALMIAGVDSPAAYLPIQRIFGPATVVVSLLSLSASLPAWRMAERDLPQIKKRERDPAGQVPTFNAREFARFFSVCNVISLVIGAVTTVITEIGLE